MAGEYIRPFFISSLGVFKDLIKKAIIGRVSNIEKKFRSFLLIFLILLSTVSCTSASSDKGTQPAIEVSDPTPTEAPLAARVNGEGILLSDYQEELQRYQAAIEQAGGTYDSSAASNIVINEMINQVLLAQAAEREGYHADETALQARLEELAEQAGGMEALTRWMEENYYSPESFRRFLERDMGATWMRNHILASMPQTADQVHARQILVRSENEAIAVQRRLQAGADFTALAYEYDPLTGGDLGWFPVGYLLQPDVENAAFSLLPGQFSGIIQTDYGFHIVYVIERDPNRSLSGEALLFKQRETLVNWLKESKNQSEIEIFVD